MTPHPLLVRIFICSSSRRFLCGSPMEAGWIIDEWHGGIGAPCWVLVLSCTHTSLAAPCSTKEFLAPFPLDHIVKSLSLRHLLMCLKCWKTVFRDNPMILVLYALAGFHSKYTYVQTHTHTHPSTHALILPTVRRLASFSYVWHRMCVCVCVWCVCVCNGQRLQADGRLDDGRLAHTGFHALPLCFLSPPFLCTASLHVFVFPYTSRSSEESPLFKKC